MKQDKKIKDLTKRELLDTITNLLNVSKEKTSNKISVADVEVESNVESLEQCTKIANKLVRKNKDFLVLRKNKLISESLGYFS